MLDKYIQIGYTKKAHGAKGQIKLVIEAPYLENFYQSEHLFLKIYGKPAPFFIERFEETDGELLLKLEEIDTPNDAKTITSKEVFLREKDLSITPANPVYQPSENSFKLLKGFLLIEETTGQIGTIKEVQEFPQQEMALVDYQEKEILIPLHPALVVSIDEEGKKITLRLPEGLMDL